LQLFLDNQSGYDHNLGNNAGGNLSNHGGLYRIRDGRGHGFDSAADSAASPAVSEEKTGCAGHLVERKPGAASDGSGDLQYRLRRVQFRDNPSGSPSDKLQLRHPYGPVGKA
jgi:hypothetical protein